MHKQQWIIFLQMEWMHLEKGRGKSKSSFYSPIYKTHYCKKGLISISKCQLEQFQNVINRECDLFVILCHVPWKSYFYENLLTSEPVRFFFFFNAMGKALNAGKFHQARIASKEIALHFFSLSLKVEPNNKRYEQSYIVSEKTAK